MLAGIGWLPATRSGIFRKSESKRADHDDADAMDPNYRAFLETEVNSQDPAANASRETSLVQENGTRKASYEFKSGDVHYNQNG